MDPNEYEGPDYDDWDTFVPEMDQTSNRAFCDNYVIHDDHWYRALNGNTYHCGGFDRADQEEMDKAYEQCEHGLSMSLCAGPMHYPPDM